MTDRDLNQNEGEGSRTAARNYYAKLRTFIRENRVDPAAREAKSFVEQHPDEAARAERKAKAGPTPLVQRIVSEGKTLWSHARAFVRRMIAKYEQRVKHAK